MGENQAKPGAKVFFFQTLVDIHEKVEAEAKSKHWVKLPLFERKLGKSRYENTTN